MSITDVTKQIAWHYETMQHQALQSTHEPWGICLQVVNWLTAQPISLVVNEL